MNEGNYIEMFNRRVTGTKATVIILAIWLLPFVAGYLLGARH